MHMATNNIPTTHLKCGCIHQNTVVDLPGLGKVVRGSVHSAKVPRTKKCVRVRGGRGDEELKCTEYTI